MSINIAEMLSTMGGKLFLGGIAGAVVSLILLIILIPVFSSAKKRLIKKINSEFDKSEK